MKIRGACALCLVFAGMVRVVSSLLDSETNFLGGWRPRIGFGKKRRTILGYCLSSLTGLLLAGMMMLAGSSCVWALDAGLDASQYAHTAWKIRDGFTKGAITAITQTPDGYLLLGTEFGLLRFDGIKAVPWEPPGGQLPSNTILSLLKARDGTIWIGTRKGLASWKDGKLTRYPGFGEQFGIPAILEDHEGTVWASGAAIPPPGKLCAIRSGNVQCYGEDGAFDIGVTALFEDSKGNLWAGVKDGLWRWKPGPPKFFSFAGEADGIRALGENIDGALLFAWKGGLWRFMDGKAEAYSPLRSLQPFRAVRLLRDRDGGLWIATSNKALLHVHQGRTDEFAQSDGLSGTGVWSFFEDGEGNVWVGTYDGLDRFREFAVATFGAKQGLPAPFVTSVLADKDGSVWLGASSLYRWKNGEISTYNKRDGKINGTFPMALFQDAQGKIWVSTHDKPGGVGYFENGRFILSGIRAKTIFSFAEDKAGNLWMVDQDTGLFRLSRQNEVQQIPWAKLGHKDAGFALAVDPSHDGLWIGFGQGGLIYYGDGQIKKSYAAADGLGGGQVYDLRFGSRGTLWAATDGGLSRIRDGRIMTLTSKNGLPCDTVHWSKEDDDHFVWLDMPCGLLRIARSELDAWVAAVKKDKSAVPTIKAAVFDISDGMRSVVTIGGIRPLVTKTGNGRLWLRGYDGVAVVDPKHLPFNKVPPPVHVEQVIADRKTYEVPAGASGSLALPALIRDMQIDYTALSLAVPEKVQFKYKLEGFDNDWQDAGNRRQAFYTNLPPKNYTFRVKACNNSGVWNEEGAFLDFSVAPAYYQTAWFRLSCVAAILALLWGLYHLRLQQLSREFNAGLEARVNERTRIARELHDSLLQGFQGLMFRLQAVRDMLPGRASEAVEALDVALERGDKAIAEGRDAVSDLRQPLADDSDMAKALTALGKELAAQSGNGTVPCVRVLLEGKQRELNPMLRDEVYRIGREALRNAFRHARAQKIEAEITYGDAEFLFHVRDDGVGLAPEVANEGARAGHWGLPGMRERAKSFGGKLEVWSEHGAGTEIELSVPASIAYGKPDARRKFRLWRRKNGESNEQRS